MPLLFEQKPKSSRSRIFDFNDNKYLYFRAQRYLTDILVFSIKLLFELLKCNLLTNIENERKWKMLSHYEEDGCKGKLKIKLDIIKLFTIMYD